MKRKRKVFLLFLFLSIAYVISFYIVGDCENCQKWISEWMEKPYIKSYLRLTLPIMIPISTVLSTWLIFFIGEEKQEKKERLQKKEKDEEKKNEVRPYFYISRVGKEKKLYFASRSSQEIVLAGVKLFYINFGYEVEETKHIGTLTQEILNDKNANYIDVKLYGKSLYIVLKAETMFKEMIYFVHKTDDFAEKNLVEDQEMKGKNKLYWKDINGYYVENEVLINILREIEVYEVNERRDCFGFQSESIEVIKALQQTSESNINELYQIILLIRFYPEKFTNDTIIALLQLLAYAFESAQLREGIVKTSNEYFANNMLGKGKFFAKYKEIFRKAEKEKESIQPSQMVSYIYEYINEYKNSIKIGNPIDKDFALRNIEVYMRDDICGRVDNNIKKSIINILVELRENE